MLQGNQRCLTLLMLLFVPGIMILAGVIFFLKQKGMPSDAVRTLWLVWVFIAVMDGILASIRMRTRVLPEGIEVMCIPLGFLRKRFRWEEIERAYARTYSPLLEYGGWGIRYTLSAGTAYNVRGNQGIQLELKNGRRVLIGTQRPQEFLAAIRTASPEKNG